MSRGHPRPDLSLSGLNLAQQQAVRVSGHCLITAPPGSGKTKVLEHRAAFLLDADPAHAVLGVTFTNDAAAELEARARAQYPAAGARLVCGTFHALCKKQLERAGLRFSLVNEVQQGELIRRAYLEILRPEDETGSGLTCELAAEHINWAKSQIEPLSDRSPLGLDKAAVLARYNELLDRMGAMDFADLLLRAVRGMRAGTVAPWPVTHMLVDECQDSDDVQYAWIREHSKRGVQVTVVGDDDQSIYGWRAARGFAGLQEFVRVHAAARIQLNITYRCAIEVLTPATRLIGHNVDRVPKTVQTANRTAGSVHVKIASTQDDEFLLAAAEIRRSGAPGEWGVLARSNDQLDRFERATKGIFAVHRTGGVSFWDTKGPALFLSVCRSLVDRHLIGIDALLRKCDIGESQIAAIHAACNASSRGALERFAQTKPYPGLVGTLQQLVGTWLDMLRAGSDRLVLYALADFIDKHATLYVNARSPEARQADTLRLMQCVESLSRLQGTLASRLQFLQTADKPAKGTAPADAVRVMTLHASKGLEFRRVWILGCAAGTMPSARSCDIPEERRLLYVGMTRAKETLFLSYPLAKDSGRSMFLDEAVL